MNQSEKTVNKTDEAAAAAAGERAHAHLCDRARAQASWCILILARALKRPIEVEGPFYFLSLFLHLQLRRCHNTLLP